MNDQNALRDAPMIRRTPLRNGWKLAGLATLLLPLPGCQSIAGSSQLSQVRIIDASPDTTGLDFYQGANILAYNLGLGSITSYVPITPGSFPISADTAGTRQKLVTATGSFLSGDQYTVLVSNAAATLQETILKDQSVPAPTGQISLRIVDESLRAGAVDLYLVPSGSTITKVNPALSGVTFGENTGYINVPTGTYTLIALPTGTTPTATGTTLYTGAAVVYAAGSAKTLVLIDQQLITTPGIQVVTANDYDSPTQTS